MDSLMKEVIRRMETVLPDLNEQERSEVKEKINKTKSQLQRYGNKNYQISIDTQINITFRLYE